MSLKRYLAEAEVRQHIPEEGDVFAIELEDGTLLETYIIAINNDTILLDATPKMIDVLHEWADLEGEAGEVLFEGQFKQSMHRAAETMELEDFVERFGHLFSPGEAEKFWHACNDFEQEVDESDYQDEVEHQDSGEYDYEGDMAKDELHTIIRAARRLNGMLDDNENMPEWVQSKITKAADYVDTAADYIESNKQRNREQGVAEGSDEWPNFGSRYAEELAQKVFDANPNLNTKGRADELQDAGWKIMAQVLGKKRANYYFNYDEDFPSDFVSAYGWLQDQQQGVAEGEDDLVDLGPALRNLTGEFNKFMKHDERMKTDPAYAKKWNKRYAKYAGNKDHNTYDDPDDDVTEGTKTGNPVIVKGCDFEDVVHWLVKNVGPVTRKSQNYYNGWQGKGWILNLLQSSNEDGIPNLQLSADTKLANNQVLAKTIQMACSGQQGVAEGSEDLRAKLDLYNEKAFEAGHRHDDQAWQKYTKLAKQIADQLGLKYKVTGYGLEILEQGVSEGSNPVGLQFDGKYYNKNGKLLGIWDGYVFTLMPEVERWWTKENGPEWVEQIKKKYTQQIQAQRGQQGMDEAKYQGREVPLGKPMRGDVKKFKVYVKDPKTGNVKKVNFGHGGTSAKRAGQKTMKIKKSNPARRRSFRARHHCENPGPRTKARYWSCRKW